MGEEEAMQVPAFAVGVGIGLDDSTILRSNPLPETRLAVIRRLFPPSIA